MRSAAGVVAVGLALSLAGDVRADLVTLDFTGTFSGTDGDASLLAGSGLAGLIGKSFTGSIRYDSAGPVTASEYRIPPDVSITNYAFGPSADAAFAATLGGAVVVSAPALAPFDVAVFRGSHP